MGSKVKRAISFFMIWVFLSLKFLKFFFGGDRGYFNLVEHIRNELARNFMHGLFA